MDAESRFPDPRTAYGDGPLAVGGDLGAPTLIEAYSRGIFPWPSGNVLYWWSPDPRCVISLDGLHVSRSLRRTLRRGALHATFDRAFGEVVAACADRPSEGTWITPDMAVAYGRLHDHGAAHSVEVWQGNQLVGGLYGVESGGVFSGESMFHRVTDASKVAMVALVEHLRHGGFALFDVQISTPHLATMGAAPMARAAFLDVLAHAPPGRWPTPLRD